MMRSRPWPAGFRRSLAPALASFGLLVAACGREAEAPVGPPPTGELVPSATAQPAAPEPSAAGTAARAEKPADARGVPCGPLDCRLFDTPEEAFRVVLDAGPRVLAVGEAHAQKGAEGVPSSTKQFTERFVPLLAGKASDLLVELMLPPKGCKQAEQKVRQEQTPVVEKQAATNQNEYEALGHAARRHGLGADALRPSCDDLDAIAKAGDESIARMLATIARLTAVTTKDLLARNERAGRPDRFVVTYGGALHNDVAPRAGREGWSFASELIAATGGRYVELDVFVPEHIQDMETWRAFDWHPHYDRAKHGDKAVLFHPRPETFILILPKTVAAPSK